MNTIVIRQLAGTEHAIRLSKRATLHLRFSTKELGFRISPEGRIPTNGETRQMSTIMDALAALLRGEDRSRNQPRLSVGRTGQLHFHRGQA